jgi:hypothetical protein
MVSRKRPAQRKNEAAHAGNHPEPPNKPPWWLFKQSDPVAGFTAWLVIFTACLTITAGFQVWAFTQSERAFVTVLSVDLSIVGKSAGEPFVIPLIVKNGGKSVAVVTDFNITLGKSLAENPEYVSSVGLAAKPVMPGTDESLVYRAKPGNWLWTLSKDELTEIEGGRQYFYIFGFIKYEDGFSLLSSRKTGFCFVYNPRPTIPNGRFETCANQKYTYAN